MNRFFKIAMLLMVCLCFATPAFAQPSGETAAAAATSISLTAIGCGLVLIGAAYGIGKIGSAAVESMARQPEVAANIQTAMMISAALIEGATFFALIVALVKG